MCYIQTSVQTPHHKSVSIEYKSKSFLASSSCRKITRSVFFHWPPQRLWFIKHQSTRVICLPSVCVLCMCVCLCVYLHVHTCMCTYANRYICVCVCMCTCVCVFMCVHMCTHVYVSVSYACVCMLCIYVCLRVYLHVHPCVCMRDFLRLI